MFLPHLLVKLSIVGSIRDREVACSARELQVLNFESCVWRAVSSHPSHNPQEVLLAQFSLYVHKSGLKPDSFHFILRPPAIRFVLYIVLYVFVIPPYQIMWLFGAVFQCWSTICDAGPTFNQQWFNASCLLGAAFTQ